MRIWSDSFDRYDDFLDSMVRLLVQKRRRANAGAAIQNDPGRAAAAAFAFDAKPLQPGGRADVQCPLAPALVDRRHCVTPGTIEIAGAGLFAVAILHTFAAPSLFEPPRRMRARPTQASGTCWAKWRWCSVSGRCCWCCASSSAAVLGKCRAPPPTWTSRNFTEPLFVFVIMVMAATRPVLQTTKSAIGMLARAVPLPGSMGFYFTVLALVPLLGSFITEPAAMTLAALILAQGLFEGGISLRLKYATLGVLFVNVSIGGTLTSFAAPPVLMVAATWNWDMAFMLSHLRLEGGAGGAVQRGCSSPSCSAARTGGAPRAGRRGGSAGAGAAGAGAPACSWWAWWPFRTTAPCSWACSCSSSA
jgi:hypothetical protein